MPLLLWVGGTALLGGLFVGSQIDDKIEQTAGTIGGGVPRSLPIEYKIPLVIAGGTAAFFLTKKLIRKV